MHPRAALTTLAAAGVLFAIPRAAHACSMALFVGPTVPSDGAVEIPANAVLFIAATGLADRIGAVTVAGDSGATTTARAVPLSADLAVSQLSLRPGERADVLVDVPDLAVTARLSVRAGAFVDTQAPVRVGRPALVATDRPQDLCFGERTVVVAEVDVAADDFGVAVYTLEEVTPIDTRTVAHVLWNEAPNADRAPFVRLEATLPLGSRSCFRVVAHDFAGNATPGPVECLAQPARDAGPLLPPIDSGFVDSGELDGGGTVEPPSVDAGPRGDARGGPGTLETIEPECACKSTRSDAGAPGAFVLLFAWAMLRAARRRKDL